MKALHRKQQERDENMKLEQARKEHRERVAAVAKAKEKREA